ncbi:MAG: toprim domain-containing protein, partial [Anaerolineales bacterium]|nr:toprim domain-containing protein [Anaerolineales bacterium]
MTFEKIDTEQLKNSVDLLTLIDRDTTTKKIAATGGGEWAGPCPKCGGKDRFRAQPDRARWLCRTCTDGKWKDPIAYGQIIHGLDFRAACEFVAGQQFSKVDRPVAKPMPKRPPLESPKGEWEQRGRTFVDYAQGQLWHNLDALGYLGGRGLTDETIKGAQLGWNPKHIKDVAAHWGLTGRPIHLPAGLVIPWFIEDSLWRIEIRKPDGRKIPPRGYKQGLFNADKLSPNKPAVLVEGAIDALTIQQEAGVIVTAVATGATTHARRARWIAKLSLCPVVLVAFDNEPDKGQAAANYWLDVLPNARRWQPFWDDPNQMLQDGASVAGWIQAGLRTDKPQPGPARWVDPDVTRHILTVLESEGRPDIWPIILWADGGTRPVEFGSVKELWAATI